MSDKYYWVIHELQGTYRYEMYKTQQGAENRESNIEGGKVYIFPSFSNNVDEVEKEFKDYLVRKYY